MEDEDQWDRLSLEEKLQELGFDPETGDSKLDDAKFTGDQLERLHGVLNMLAGAISVGHSTLEKTASSECSACQEVAAEWNELLRVE